MKHFLSKALNKLSRFANWLSQAATPTPKTKRLLWLPAGLLLVISGGYLNVVSQVGAGFWIDFVTGAIGALILGALLALILWLSKALIHRAGRHLGLLPLAAALMAAWLLSHIGGNLAYVLVALAFSSAYLLVFAMVLFAKRSRYMVASVALLAGAWLGIGVVHWFVQAPAGESPVASLVTTHSGEQYAHLAQPGPYRVEHFTYGSGDDKRRADYADDIRFQTQSVDASKMLESWSGWRGRMRTRAWGFGPEALPLNAQVWMPQQSDISAPLPLTLIVHGNAHMFRRSELGYAWLAEHLASRGHIVVSVDQNFINGGGFLYDGLFPENDARGWMMLEHLRQWHEWNANPEHPLYNLLDEEQITLMGHSRGGEAVYLAGVFNQLAYYPDDTSLTFDYNFGISGVVAIAPVDGQFRPAGQSAVLTDTNFFTVHGGHDSDAFFFHGDRQYYRAEPNYDEGQFKASLYLHHANHGQFNTEWGELDYYGLYGQALNTAVLLPGEKQRRAAKGYFTAFVEQAQSPDTTMFCDANSAGNLLPTDIVIARCQTQSRHIIADYNDGIDVTSGRNGTRIEAHGLALWKEGMLPFRLGHRERSGVWLGWDNTDEHAEDAYYQLTLPTGGQTGTTLLIELAQLDQDPPGYQLDNGSLREAADFIIEVTDVSGNTLQRRVSELAGGITPPLPASHVREDKLLGMFSLAQIMPKTFESHRVTEAVMQTISMPLDKASDEPLQVDAIHSVRLIFDDGAAVLIIDEVSLI